MPETMPAPNFEKDEKNIEMNPDKRLTNSLAELKEKEEKIIKKINNAKGNEKQILEMDLENIKNQIKRYEDSIKRSFKRNIKRKKTENLKKDVGEKKLAEVIDFQKEKRKREEGKKIDEETKKSIGGNFLADYENFRKKRNI